MVQIKVNEEAAAKLLTYQRRCRYPGSDCSLGCAPSSGSLLMHTLGVAGDSSSTWDPAAHNGDM